jgi:glucose/arabinose dehydrogenase
LSRPRVAAIAVTVVTVVFASAQHASAGTVPSGFQDTVAISGLEEPTALSLAPDGRVFVAEKSGLIKVYSSLNDSTPTVFADLRTEVYNLLDRGLLGLTVDPQFPARPYVYALYTRDALPGGNAPYWGDTGESSDECPYPPGATSDGCVATGRLVRLTASGDTATSQTTLITDWCQQYPSHSIGDLAFGPDGKLYVSGGDGASFVFADWGQEGIPRNPCGDPPDGSGTALEPPTAEGGALRSQDARTTSDPTDPTGLDGTLLRVDPDTGAGLPGNPFFTTPNADENEKRIVAIGLRNPFRIAFRPGTGELWAAEVGWRESEEINRLVDPGGLTPDNFGWPCYEGEEPQDGYDDADLDLCEDLYDQGQGAVVDPYYDYFHYEKVVAGESCSTGSSSTSALAFYPSGPFPDSYDGTLFFGDYSRGCIWAMRRGGGALPDPANIQTFDTGVTPVDLDVSQGELFYVDIGEGAIRRIRYPSGNSPPNAVATATPSNGNAPLTTTLSASSSTDPNGDSLSYAWDLDEDGQFDDSNQVSVQKTYSQGGTYDPEVRVSDPGGASDSDSVQVQVNNTPPSAQINAPTSSATWGVGDAVQFSGSATDSQQTLPNSAFDWQVVINHCPSNCHDHVMQAFPDRKSGSFNAPDHDYPSHLTVELTVTDAGGLSDTESVAIYPRTVGLTLNSIPSGLQIAVGPTQGTAPFTQTVIEDSKTSLSAPISQTLGAGTYNFDSWSDGGAASHNVTASASQAFTATYDLSMVQPPLAPPVLGEVGGGSKRCGGVVATEVGTKGDDRLAGTQGADVIVGGGGDDELIGKGGGDVLCGGDDADRLSGGRGPDTLIGGGATDACGGGKGADVERSCEPRKP